VARIALTGIDVTIDAVAQDSSTTIGAVGGYAVVVATALPQIGVTLTSSYLAAMIGDIAASHLCSVPGGPPIIGQHVLPRDQPGQTHAQACLLDHVAELRNILDAFHGSAATVTVDIADNTLQRADRAWSAREESPPA
jgi:ethanolamine transporter EutH